MKKCYHFFYTMDDFVHGDPEPEDFDSWFPEENELFRDVKSYLDQQNFDISISVINRLVEYAGRQFRGPYRNIH
jgi:hypothetical protein